MYVVNLWSIKINQSDAVDSHSDNGYIIDAWVYCISTEQNDLNEESSTSWNFHYYIFTLFGSFLINLINWCSVVGNNNPLCHNAISESDIATITTNIIYKDYIVIYAWST